MHDNLKLAGVAALAICLTLPATVLAHGKKKDGHEEASAVDYSKAEQQPFGRAADPADADHVIDIEMSDQMRFSPDRIEVERGDTVRLVVRNGGKLLHELVLGTRESLVQHAEMMKKFPGMEHDEPYMAHVQPGEQGVLGWQFNQPGEYGFGCLIPGHFDAGMKGTVIVR